MVPIFCYARGTVFRFLKVPLAHAHFVSFDYPMFGHDCKEPIELDGDANIEEADNLIQLTGYPDGPDKASAVGRVTIPKLIKLHDTNSNQVYDLTTKCMPNGSLDCHLFRGGSILSWKLRCNIALGLAEEWEKCDSQDIKSSNIMLDSNFNTKLGDFGLARLMDHEKGSVTTVVAGTKGYLAPAYMDTGKARKESDIFSFGLVLLEIACGKKAIHHQELEGEVSLVEWVWKLYGLRNLTVAVDDVEQLECLLIVGLWCANPDNTSRPCIKKVIKVQNFEAPLPILPQNRPFLASLSPTTNK